MVGLIKSEFRKILTTKLWWALLIPAAIVTLAGSWGGAWVSSLESLKTELGMSLPFGLLSVARATNFATIFAAIFGTLAVSGEYRTKTITTTYLTGVPRGAVLGAKLVAYTAMGLVYGVVNIAAASAGALLGSGAQDFPAITDWMALGGIGLLAMVLWMLLGVGVGALITSPIGSVLGIVIYTMVIENAAVLTLNAQQITSVQGYLPNTAGAGMVSDLAARLFVEPLEQRQPGTGGLVLDPIRQFAGAGGSQVWWLSLIIFAAYGAVLCLAGWLTSRQRDIT